MDNERKRALTRKNYALLLLLAGLMALLYALTIIKVSAPASPV